MTFLEHLPAWMRRARPTDAATPRPPLVESAATRTSPSHDDPGDADARLDAAVMRRRVRHFCEERPPAQRIRRR